MPKFSLKEVMKQGRFKLAYRSFVSSNSCDNSRSDLLKTKNGSSFAPSAIVNHLSINNLGARGTEARIMPILVRFAANNLFFCPRNLYKALDLS